MVQPAACEAKASRDVFRFEVRQLLEHLLRREPRRQEVQHVNDPDAHAPNAGASPALARIHGDAISEVCHDIILSAKRERILRPPPIARHLGQPSEALPRDTS